MSDLQLPDDVPKHQEEVWFCIKDNDIIVDIVVVFDHAVLGDVIEPRLGRYLYVSDIVKKRSWITIFISACIDR